jgi:hypothetical protein
MKSIKMALLGGAALAVTAAGAQADDLEALKAQIEALNARVAAMESAPSVPAGYQLLAISQGERQDTPGLEMSARERFAYGDKATVISVIPTADAPAGATITWSGYARAGLVYGNTDSESRLRFYDYDDGDLVFDTSEDFDGGEEDDIDVKARGQLRVTATTDTAVGEIGVDLRMRANFNGNGEGDVYMDVAWGYWAMTPELTFGGGYAGSLGNIGYGYDGACSCYYTDNADLGFNPGDTTQMRLSYASGPFSMAIALEDGSFDGGDTDDSLNDQDAINGDKLGVAGEVKYSGDMFSGEISAVWRDSDEDTTGADANWQVGAGVGFGLGDIASLSLAAAMGEGFFATFDEGGLSTALPYNNQWWGVSALATFNLTDEVHAELGAGYKNRDGDDFSVETCCTDTWLSDGVDYETWGVLAGIYYTPVDQLTIGLEGEWYTVEDSATLDETDPNGTEWDRVKYDGSSDTYSVDLVAVWRF